MPTYQPVSLEASGMAFTKTIYIDTYPFISSSKSNLDGRSVFITGASKGIGLSTAISYARAGASKIAVGARSDLDAVEKDMLAAAKENGKPVPQILKLKIDLQDRETVRRAAAEVKKAFGGLDILVNNAGVLEIYTKIIESDEHEWWNTWEVNMRGVYWVTKDFLPLILDNSDGLKTILNLSSVGAHRLTPGGSGYQTTKLAVIKFTEFIMMEYGESGILAYAIHPGGIPTQMGNRLPEANRVNLKDTPELAGDTIVWLTQEKRDWLAGRYLSCTWDMEEVMGMKDEIVKGDKLKVRLVL